MQQTYTDTQQRLETDTGETNTCENGTRRRQKPAETTTDENGSGQNNSRRKQNRRKQIRAAPRTDDHKSSRTIIET